MKQQVTNRPPFGIELRFERTEIDLMCVEELEKAEALPATPGPINIESFIGQHLCRDYGYEDLPDGVLGVTAFEPNGAIKFVGVSSKLDDDSPSAEHRIRSTWAHEAGHCILHPSLFMREPASRAQLLWEQASDNVTSDRRFLCREQDFKVQGANCGYDGRWWEWQANRCIGGFLLPKILVLKALETILRPSRVTQTPELQEENRSQAESLLSQVFNVSMAVSKIRLAEFFPQRAAAQLTF
ncbi:MAG: hypothetical protein HS113_17445 [Verrucomicrobiales bacterium]|nr:hypothetical protein [Verrucomicrobiales bacterium]